MVRWMKEIILKQFLNNCLKKQQKWNKIIIKKRTLTNENQCCSFSNCKVWLKLSATNNYYRYSTQLAQTGWQLCVIIIMPETRGHEPGDLHFGGTLKVYHSIYGCFCFCCIASVCEALLLAGFRLGFWKETMMSWCQTVWVLVHLKRKLCSSSFSVGSLRNTAA